MTHALRSLGRDPGFVFVAVVALSLGLGANTAIFSVIDAVLLRPLPYPEPERLVAVFETHREKSLMSERPAPGNFLDWRARSRSLEGLVVWYSGTAILRDERGPEALRSAKVSPDFFRVLGVRPALGNAFSNELRGAVYSVADQYRAGDREAVLSDGVWKRRFGSDPAVVGRELSIDGAAFRIVGVLPAGFAMPSLDTDLYLAWDIPSSYLPNDGPGPRFLDGPPRDYRFLNVVGRLRSGVGLAEAQAELDQIALALGAAHPKEDAGWGVRLHPLKEEIVGPTRAPLLALLGAAGFVLLIACANVASLQLARSAARAREIAVRTALGASPRRLATMLLSESLLLSAIGATLGLLVAWRGVPALLNLLPSGLPRVAEVGMDLRVFLFATVFAVLCAVASGLVPVLQAMRADVLPALAENGGRGPTTAAGRQGLRKALVTTEVAAALVLLVGAGLFARSFARLRAVDPGFEPRHVLAFRVALYTDAYRTGGRSAEFYRELMTRLRALPGVLSAAAVNYLPLQDRGFDRRFFREGEPDPGASALHADLLMSTPGYFQTIGMKLLGGRDFSDRDRRDTPRVIVVNQTMARQTWPNDDPLGKRLMIDLNGLYPYEVVGVVNDTRHMGLKNAPRREVFLPHGQAPYLAMNVLVRASGDPSLLTKAVAREVAALDPAQPVERVRMMEDVVSAASAADRFAAALLVALALVAAALAATGIYGLLSYLVARRSHELGVRLALGAERRDVLRLVMGESARLLTSGTALGLLLSLVLARLVSALLFEVSAYDAATFGAVPLAMALLGLAASYVPARRAMRVDPIVALRAE